MCPNIHQIFLKMIFLPEYWIKKITSIIKIAILNQYRKNSFSKNVLWFCCLWLKFSYKTSKNLNSYKILETLQHELTKLFIGSCFDPQNTLWCSCVNKWNELPIYFKRGEKLWPWKVVIIILLHFLTFCGFFFSLGHQYRQHFSIKIEERHQNMNVIKLCI